jgi:hypothetical protein
MWSAEDAHVAALTESSLAEDSKYLSQLIQRKRRDEKRSIDLSVSEAVQSLSHQPENGEDDENDDAYDDDDDDDDDGRLAAAAVSAPISSASLPPTDVGNPTLPIMQLSDVAPAFLSSLHGQHSQQRHRNLPVEHDPRQTTPASSQYLRNRTTLQQNDTVASPSVGHFQPDEPAQTRSILQSSSELMHDSPIRINSIAGSFRSAEFGPIMSDDPVVLQDLCRSWVSELKSVFIANSDYLFSHCSADVRAVLPWDAPVSLCDPTSALLNRNTLSPRVDKPLAPHHPHLVTQNSDVTSTSLFVTAVKFVLEMLQTSDSSSSALDSGALQRALQTVIDMAVHLPVCCFSQPSDNSSSVLDHFFHHILRLLGSSALSDVVRSATLLCGILMCCLSGNPVHVLLLAQSTSLDQLAQEVDEPLRLLADQKLADLQNCLPCPTPSQVSIRQCFQVGLRPRGTEFTSIGVKSIAVSLDGAFIFAHGTAGLLKIGTGKRCTVPGTVYAWRHSFYSHDSVSSMCCVPRGLLYRSASISPAICVVLDSESLAELGRVHSDGNGSWRTKNQSSVPLLAPEPALSPRRHGDDVMPAPHLRAPSRARGRRKSHQRSRSDETQPLAAIVRDPNPIRLDGRDTWRVPQQIVSGTFVSNQNHLFLVYVRSRTIDVVTLNPESFDVSSVSCIPLARDPSFDDATPIHVACDLHSIFMVQLCRKGCQTARIPIQALSQGSFSCTIVFTAGNMWTPLSDAKVSCGISWDLSESRLWCASGSGNLFASFSASSHPTRLASTNNSTTVSSIVANMLQLTYPRFALRLDADSLQSISFAAAAALAQPKCAHLGVSMLLSFVWLADVPFSCVPNLLFCMSFPVPAHVSGFHSRVWTALLPLVFKDADAVTSWVLSRLRLSPLPDPALHATLLFLATRPSLFVPGNASLLPPSLTSLLISLVSVPLPAPSTSAAVDFISSIVAFAPALILPLLELCIAQMNVQLLAWGPASLTLYSRLLHLVVHSALPEECWRSLASTILRMQKFFSVQGAADLEAAPKSCLCLPLWFSGDHDSLLRCNLDNGGDSPDAPITREHDFILSPASGTPVDSNSDSDAPKPYGFSTLSHVIQTPHPFTGPVEFSTHASLPECTGIILQLDPRSCPDSLYIVYTQSTGYALPMRVFEDPSSRQVFVPCDNFILKFVYTGSSPIWGFRLSLRPYRSSSSPAPTSQYCAALAKCATVLLKTSASRFPWEDGDHALGLAPLMEHPLFRNTLGGARPIKGRAHQFCHEILQRSGLGASFLAWRSSIEQDTRVSDDSLLSQAERVALACILWHCRLSDDAMKLAELHALDPKTRMTAACLRENGIALPELVRACHAVRVIRDGNVVENLSEMIRRGLLLLNLDLAEQSTDRQGLAVFILDFLLRDSLAADTVIEALKQRHCRFLDAKLGFDCYRVVFESAHRFWGTTESDDSLALASWCALAESPGAAMYTADQNRRDLQIDAFSRAETCSLASLDQVDVKRFVFSGAFAICTLDASQTPKDKLASFQKSTIRLWLSSSTGNLPGADFAALVLRMLAARCSASDHYPLFMDYVSKYSVCNDALDRMEASLRLAESVSLDEGSAAVQIPKQISAVLAHVQSFRSRFWDIMVIADVEARVGDRTATFDWRILCRAMVLCPPHFRRLILRAVKRKIALDFHPNMLRDLTSLVGRLNFAPAFADGTFSSGTVDPALLLKATMLVETMLGIEETGFDSARPTLVLSDPHLDALTGSSGRPCSWGAFSLKNASFDVASANGHYHVRAASSADQCEARFLADRAVNDSTALVYWEINFIECNTSFATWSSTLGFIDCSSGLVMDSDGALPETISVGDIVGCGWIPREAVIFFTWNGIIAPETVRNAHGVFAPYLSLRLLGHLEGSLHPYIDFESNFGDTPFAFDVGHFAADPRSSLPNSLGVLPPASLDMPACWAPCAGLVQDIYHTLRDAIRDIDHVKSAWQLLQQESFSSLHSWIRSLTDLETRDEEVRSLDTNGSSNDDAPFSDDDSFSNHIALSLGCISILAPHSDLPLSGCLTNVLPSGRACLVIEAPLSGRSDAWVGVLDFEHPTKLLHVSVDSIDSGTPRTAGISLSSVEFSFAANILSFLHHLPGKVLSHLCDLDLAVLRRIESYTWSSVNSALEELPSGALLTKLNASNAIKLIQSASECACSEDIIANVGPTMPGMLLEHRRAIAERSHMISAARAALKIILRTDADMFEAMESRLDAALAPGDSADTGSDPDFPSDRVDTGHSATISEEGSTHMSSNEPKMAVRVGSYVTMVHSSFEEPHRGHEARLGYSGTVIAIDDTENVALIRFDELRGRWLTLWLPLGSLSLVERPTSATEPKQFTLAEKEHMCSILHARDSFHSLLIRIAAEYAGPSGTASLPVQNWRRRRGSSTSFPVAMAVLQSVLRLLQERRWPEFFGALAPRAGVWQALSTMRECWSDMFALSSPRRAMSVASEFLQVDDMAGTSAVRVSGFLTKQGKMFKQWKKYWCVIDRSDPSILTYYKSPEALVPAGLIDLTRVASVEAFASSEKDKRAKMDKLVFQLITDTKGISLGAPTFEEKERWVSALQESLRRPSTEPALSSPTLVDRRVGRPDPIAALVLEECGKLLPTESSLFEFPSRYDSQSQSIPTENPVHVEYCATAALVHISASPTNRMCWKAIHLPDAEHLLIEFHLSSFLADGDSLRVFLSGSPYAPIGVFSGTRHFPPIIARHTDSILLNLELDSPASSVIALISHIHVPQVGSLNGTSLRSRSGLFYLSWLLECPAPTLQGIGMVPLPESPIWSHILDCLTASLAPFGKISLHRRLIIFAFIARLLRRWGDVSTRAMLPAIIGMFPAAQELFSRYDDEISHHGGLFSPYLQRLFEVVAALHSLRLEDGQDDPRMRISSEGPDFVAMLKSDTPAEQLDADQPVRVALRDNANSHPWFYEMASIAKAIESFSTSTSYPVAQARQAFYDAHASELMSSSSKSHWPMFQESPHPYPAGVRVTSRVYCPRAQFFIISFDPRSQTRAGNDWLLLSHDRAGGDDLGAFAGTFPHEDVVVRGDSFVWSFISQPDSSRSCWGFRFTVTPLFDDEIKHQISTSVEDDLAALAADREWSLQIDLALCRVVSEVTHRSNCSYRDVTAADAWKQALDLELSDLVRFGFSSFYRRLTLLKHTNWQLTRLFPLVDLSLLKSSGSIASHLVSCRSIFFLEVKLDLLRSYLASTITSLKRPTISISRGLFGSDCAFSQCYKQLTKVFSGALMQPDRCFLVRLVGEGAVDLGGPYQDLLSWVCSDIASAGLGLFIPSPNMARQSGSHQDRLVPSPASFKVEPHQKHFFFVGQIIGMAIRSNVALDIAFPSAVWKVLVGLPLDRRDLLQIDQQAYDLLQLLDQPHEKQIDSSNFANLVDQPFTVLDYDGNEVELVENGRLRQVTWATRKEFVQMAERFKFDEISGPVHVIKRGIQSLIPNIELLHLFSWQELESIVSGRQGFDVHFVRMNTVYNGLTPHSQVVSFLWSALEAMSPKDQAAFLRFVSGRSRLSNSSNFTLTLCHLAKSRENPDKFLPEARTCFITLYIPEYSTLETAKQKIYQAIKLCQEIDADFNIAEATDVETVFSDEENE